MADRAYTAQEVERLLGDGYLLYNPIDGLSAGLFTTGSGPELRIGWLTLDELDAYREGYDYLDDLVSDPNGPASWTCSPDVGEWVERIAGDPCWVEGTGLNLDLVARCEDVVERYGEDSYLVPEIDGPACVVFSERSFASPGRLGFWRDHFLAATGRSSATRDEVLGFAREKMSDELAELCESIDAASSGHDVLCARVIADGGGHCGTYLLSSPDLEALAAVATSSSAPRTITRCEELQEGSAIVTFDDGTKVELALVHESSLEPALFVPTSAHGLSRYIDDTLIDRAGRSLRLADRYGYDYVQRRPSPAAETARVPKPEIEAYLRAALEEYRGKTGWKGLDADGAIASFCRFIGSGECSVAPPAPEQLRLPTPDGDLVATVLDDGDYKGIVIDVEKDGRSGQVCEAEWVSPRLRQPDAGAEAVYPTAFHAFSWDGNEEDVSSRTDVDADGREMFYPPREPLSVEVARAKAARAGDLPAFAAAARIVATRSSDARYDEKPRQKTV